MSSSYPPPPSTSSNGAPGSPSQGQPSPISPHASQPSHYDGLPSPTSQSAVVAAAHHGLQALQAATAGSAPLAPAAAGASASVGDSPGSSPYPPLAPDGTPPSYSQRNASRQTRLRRACDMCSARKIKCDESGPPCRPCASLMVDCTFSREMKRRGPPNKHAEAVKAAKRARMEGGGEMSASPHNAAETLVSIASNESAMRGLDAEAIAPWEILVLLVDDFFTYIHPLAPFPHEPSFRESFMNREDQTDPSFLALLASMIGCLVASFPRSAKFHLKSQHNANLFPRAITMIEKCRLVALEARGPLFYNREEKTVHDAAASYFLGLAAGYTFQWKLFRRFMVETMSFIQELGHHRRRDPSQQLSALQLQYAPSEPRQFSHIEDQVGKRIFYIMLLCVRSMTQLGAGANEIVFPPSTDSDPYPDKPVEVDDAYIYVDRIMPQPPGTLSLMTGFNRGIDIYMTMNPLAGVELSYGITQLPWSNQKNMLNECVQAAKQVTERLPAELSINLAAQGPDAGSEAGTAAQPIQLPPTDYFDDLPGFQYYPPSESMESNDLRRVLGTQPERRRQVQFDIQKTNIYASQLATRSYYVELYLNLRDAARDKGQLPGEAAAEGSADSGDPIDNGITAERELIVQHLLAVLRSIPLRNMEPNGSALSNKIRQVASTLLNDAPERKGPVAMGAEEHLGRFVEITMRLEKMGAAPGGDGDPDAMTPKDEEQELRDWADLREHQARFAQSGGFLATPT